MKNCKKYKENINVFRFEKILIETNEDDVEDSFRSEFILHKSDLIAMIHIDLYLMKIETLR